jgi:hypothetical protein
MQRIQYHRYSGPEEMRLETYHELPAHELPASADMFMIRAPFPRPIGKDFSGSPPACNDLNPLATHQPSRKMGCAMKQGQRDMLEIGCLSH